MPTHNLASVSLHYLEGNPHKIPIVLLLHGLGANASSWQMQIPALLHGGFHVIAPDIPGFGRSTYPGGGTSIAKLTSYLACFLEDIHAFPVHAIGISMGGTLALELALDHPDFVEKLVLVNTFAKLQKGNPTLWPYFLVRFLLVHTLGLPTQARAVAKRIFPHPEQEELRQVLIDQICESDPQGYRAILRALAVFNVQDRLHEIRSPTLVITGNQDTTIPPKNQKSLVDQIPFACQVFIEQAGHAVSVDQPERFNRVILEYLKN
jgi:pimeloyl-ACP methyl ester carboxylesterase